MLVVTLRRQLAALNVMQTQRQSLGLDCSDLLQLRQDILDWLRDN